MTTHDLWPLDHPSQEFSAGPKLKHEAGNVTIAYDYETETGVYAWEEMQFLEVQCLRFTIADRCTEEQVKSYDRVRVVDSFDWAASVPMDGNATCFSIFFDEVGCYEVVARAFRPPSSGTE